MTLNIGFIGTGGIARAHQEQLSKISGVTVSAFASGSRAHAEQAAQRWTDAKAYDSLRDMLDDQKLNAVYICVPPHSHDDLEELLIERNIPFLVEKPLGVDHALPLKIGQGVQSANLLTSVGYHWRYLDSVTHAASLLKDATVGMALGYWMGTMPMADWWIRKATSGGQFVEQTTHIVDMLRLLCGEVSEVYAAFGQKVMHEKVQGADVCDVGTVTMKLANGAVATISNTCLLPTYHRTGLEIFTHECILEIQENGLKVIENDKTTEYKNTGPSPLYKENEAFIHALLTGDRSRIRSDYQDALKTHAVTLAANESAITGKAIQLN